MASRSSGEEQSSGSCDVQEIFEAVREGSKGSTTMSGSASIQGSSSSFDHDDPDTDRDWPRTPSRASTPSPRLSYQVETPLGSPGMPHASVMPMPPAIQP